MNDSADRLKQARINRGFDRPTDAAEAFGWNVNTYRSHENGNRSISKKAAIRYSKALNVSVDWLLTGTTKYGTKINQDDKNNDNNSLVPIRFVPLLDVGHEYMGITALQKKENHDLKKIPVVTLPSMSSNLFCMQLTDNSMAEENLVDGVSYSAGHYIIIDMDAKIKPGDLVLAIDPKDKSVYFRKYKVIDVLGDKQLEIELYPLNKNYPSMRLQGKLSDLIVGRLCQTIAVNP